MPTPVMAAALPATVALTASVTSNMWPCCTCRCVAVLAVWLSTSLRDVAVCVCVCVCVGARSERCWSPDEAGNGGGGL